MVQLSYTTYISEDLAHHKIFCAKVGKGGIILSCVCYVFVRVCLYVLFGHLLGKG